MTLEEISVVFNADVGPFAAAVSQVSSLLSAAGSQADGMASQFYSAGASAGAGLASGLSACQGAVAAAARALADAASSALRGALSIHSPSRVTYEIGAFFDEGLLEGIAGGAGSVEKEAEALSDRAAHALSAPEVSWPIAPLPALSASPAPMSADQALSQLSITIPLEVDGYRLGVAAIEGINQVSRGTGRTELAL